MFFSIKKKNTNIYGSEKISAKRNFQKGQELWLLPQNSFFVSETELIQQLLRAWILVWEGKIFVKDHLFTFQENQSMNQHMRIEMITLTMEEAKFRAKLI